MQKFFTADLPAVRKEKLPNKIFRQFGGLRIDADP
jgi:hypothetical protein